MLTPEILQYKIAAKMQLNASFMSFLKEDGIFIPTTKTFVLGQKILAEITFPEDSQPTPVEGEVVWITFANSHYHEVQGVGIKISGINVKDVHLKIQKALDTVKDYGEYTME